MWLTPFQAKFSTCQIFRLPHHCDDVSEVSVYLLDTSSKRVKSSGFVQRGAFGLCVSSTNKGANVAANRLHAAVVFDTKRLFSFVFYFRHDESDWREILINCNLITPVVGSQSDFYNHVKVIFYPVFFFYPSSVAMFYKTCYLKGLSIHHLCFMSSDLIFHCKTEEKRKVVKVGEKALTWVFCVCFPLSSGQFPRHGPARPPTRNWRHSSDPGEM